MQKSTADLATQLEQRLMAQYGPLLSGPALYRVLGFKSAAALRQAIQRDQLRVQLFAIANRRGKFALTLHVAQWLAECSASGTGVPGTPSALPGTASHDAATATPSKAPQRPESMGARQAANTSAACR